MSPVAPGSVRRRGAAVPALALLLVLSLACDAGAPPPGSTAGSEAPVGEAGTAPLPAPNIVVVLTDDQRADTLSCTGHPFVHTPHLDRVAAEGTLFANAFVTTSLCCPSRATLLTGLYAHRSGVTSNNVDLDYSTTPILPQFLKGRGYSTAFIGKYHLGDDLAPRPGFDYWAALDAAERDVSVIRLAQGEVRVPYAETTDRLAELALTWLQEQAAEPFFLLLAVRTPHIPPEPAPRHADLYTDVPIALPPSFEDGPAALPVSLQDATARRGLQAWLARWPRPETALTDFIRQYARMIPGVDEMIGRLDARLEALRLRERTALIFTSDNGYALGEHGLFRKGLAYEPSIRVPLILRVPGGRPGGRPPQQALNLDLAPTILELAGVARPPSMPGRSLLPLISGEAGSWRHDWLYVGNHPRGSGPRHLAVRTPDWKYIRYREGRIEEELFDLVNDPDERRNLARRPQQQAVLQAMRRRLRELMAREQVPESWWEPAAAVR